VIPVALVQCGTNGRDRFCTGITTIGDSFMRALNIVTLLLVIIGGINWGLVGLFDFDLVTAILGNGSAETATSSAAARVVYILVALSALYQIGPLVRTTTTDRAVAYR
jgi:uncharacterized protein